MIEFAVLDQDRLDQRRTDAEASNCMLAYHARNHRHALLIATSLTHAQKQVSESLQIELDAYFHMTLGAEKETHRAQKEATEMENNLKSVEEDLVQQKCNNEQLMQKLSGKSHEIRRLRDEMDRLKAALPLKLRREGPKP